MYISVYHKIESIQNGLLYNLDYYNKWTKYLENLKKITVVVLVINFEGKI